MSSTYITSKIDNKSYCKTNGQFTRHIKKHNLTYQEYYEKYVTEISSKCYCDKPLTFYQKNHTYANSCGDPICVGKTISVVKGSWTDEQRKDDRANKKKAASLRTDEQVQRQIEKTRITQRAKNDGLLTPQTEKFKNKAKATKLERYGNEYYANSKQASRTKAAFSNEKWDGINEQRRSTNLERYGYENLLMHPDVIKKSAASNSLGKEYTLSNNTVVKIHGYEGVAYDKLIQVYGFKSIIYQPFNHSSKLTYVNVNEHNHKYYPDFYIPNENLIIEIKSRWWYDANGRKGYEGRLINNQRKRQCAIDAGYNYQLWLWNGSSKEFDIYD